MILSIFRIWFLLEKDEVEFQRAVYNAPYGCISIQNTDSTQYISDLSIEDGEHNIFWLDFVAPPVNLEHSYQITPHY